MVQVIIVSDGPRVGESAYVQVNIAITYACSHWQESYQATGSVVLKGVSTQGTGRDGRRHPPT